jgi:hypothetical protein
MLTKTKSAALTPSERLTEIAALLADAIITLNAQGRLSASSSESLSESRQDSLDSSANSGLCVDTRDNSVPQDSNQGVQHGA